MFLANRFADLNGEVDPNVISVVVGAIMSVAKELEECWDVSMVNDIRLTLLVLLFNNIGHHAHELCVFLLLECEVLIAKSVFPYLLVTIDFFDKFFSN